MFPITVCVVMAAAIRVVVGLSMFPITVCVVMAAAIRVVVGLSMFPITVCVVMAAAVGVVVSLSMFPITVCVVVAAAVGVVVGLVRHTGSPLKRHFMQFFSIQRHAGMVATGGLHMVIAAAVFPAVGGMMVFLLSRKNRCKPQRCKGNGQKITFHCFSVN